MGNKNSFEFYVIVCIAVQCHIDLMNETDISLGGADSLIYRPYSTLNIVYDVAD